MNKIARKILPKDINSLLVAAIITAGIFIRVFYFADVPCGINQDEAYAGYNAYSLLNFGIDASGYSFPVYFVAWGSGMNVLNSYLMIPFIALFGLETWVIRLPQLIISIVSLFCLFDMIRRIFDKKCAVFCLAILAFCPWHIMLSRWGLESNLAPGTLLISLHLFVLAIQVNKKFMLLSAFALGLSLYSYSIMWPFVFCMVVAVFVYCLIFKKIKFDSVTVMSIVILLIISFPLVLFLLVNYNFIPEIRLPYFSVPKLTYLRNEEFSFLQIPDNFINTVNLLFTENDGLIWNCMSTFGIFYHVLFLLFIFGVICFFINFSIKKFNYGFIILVIFVFSFILGLLVNVNINRINIIFIPMFIFAGYGLNFLADKLTRLIFPISILAIFSCMVFFSFNYFTHYNKDASYQFAEGLEEVVDSLSEEDEHVFVSSKIYYSSLLFYLKEDANTFVDTVEYVTQNGAFNDVKRFDKYEYFYNVKYSPNSTYVVSNRDDISAINKHPNTKEKFGNYVVIRT